MAKISLLKKVDLSGTLKAMQVGDFCEVCHKDMTQTAASATCTRMKELGLVFSVKSISDDNLWYRITRES